MKRDEKYYYEKGRRAYEIGIIIIPISSPRGWQQAAERRGYSDARLVWKGANPKADEWKAAEDRNRAFCAGMMKG